MDTGTATVVAALIAFSGVVLGFWLRYLANRESSLTLAKHIAADIIDKQRVTLQFLQRARTLAGIFSNLEANTDLALNTYDVDAVLGQIGWFVRDLKESKRLVDRKVYDSKSDNISEFPEDLAVCIHNFYHDYFDIIKDLNDNMDVMMNYGFQELETGETAMNISHVRKGLDIAVDYLSRAIIETAKALREMKNVYTSIRLSTVDLK